MASENLKLTRDDIEFVRRVREAVRSAPDAFQDAGKVLVECFDSEAIAYEGAGEHFDLEDAGTQQFALGLLSDSFARTSSTSVLSVDEATARAILLLVWLLTDSTDTTTVLEVCPMQQLPWTGWGTSGIPSRPSREPVARDKLTRELIDLGQVAWELSGLAGSLAQSTSTAPDAETRTASEGGTAEEEGLPAQQLADRYLTAWRFHNQALEAAPELSKDRDIYEWLREHAWGGDAPSFGTWARNVRGARKALGRPKNTRGRGFTTRSVVRVEDIDPRRDES